MIKEIDIRPLIVDRTYQRDQKKDWINKTVKCFDSTALGVITVNVRKDGQTAILDGQQRREVCLKKGIYRCDASIYEGLSLLEEAEKFQVLNDKTNMHFNEKFKAKLVSCDPISKDIMRIITKTGFKVGKTGPASSAIISCIQTLDSIYCNNKNLEDTLNFVYTTWYMQNHWTKSTFIRGVSLFLKSARTQPHFDKKYASRKYSLVLPSNIIAKYGSTTGCSGGSIPKNIAQGLIEMYNKGYKSSSPNRLKDLK